MAPHVIPQIIMNADDFGLHPSTNEAIELAHREGCVSAASLMVLGQAAEDAVSRVRALPSLDIGLHFTLVGVPDFPTTLGSFLHDYSTGKFPSSRIENALRRQLDLAVRSSQIPISHIDSHQHLHVLPSIMRIVCRLAAEYSIPGIRLPNDDSAFAPLSPGRRVQAATLRTIARLTSFYIPRYGRRTTQHFSGMAVSGHLTGPILAEYLQQTTLGTREIVCHPGMDNAALAAQYDWGYDWSGELSALCSRQANEAIATNRVRLVSWREL